jgi:tRNA dimethylallyltransferase
VRAALEARAAAAGSGALHAELSAVDPESAARLAPADLQRIVRALEVWRTSGRTLTWWHRQPSAAPLAARWRVLQLVAPAEDLAEGIARRTRGMFASGLIEETRALRERGLEAPLVALRAVGYDEALALLDGRLTREEAEARTSLRTRQLAKRQTTWFRHQIHAARLDSRAGTAAERLDAAIAMLGAD